MSGPRLVQVLGAAGWWTTGSLRESGGLAITRCGHWMVNDAAPVGWNVTHLLTGRRVLPPHGDAEYCPCLPLRWAKRWHSLLVPLAAWAEIHRGNPALAVHVNDAFFQVIEEFSRIAEPLLPEEPANDGGAA